ncbi:MAG: 3'-5' exonuclease [Burkholderiaceae bacterium]
MASALTGLPTRWLAALRAGWLRRRLRDQNHAFLFDPPPADEWVSLDCETTGLDPRRDEIISIAAVRIVGSRILTSERLELLVRPTGSVSATSVRIHLLREQDVADGIEADDAVRQLLRFIGGRPIVGYYIAFDVAMLNRVVRPLLGIGLPQPTIDVGNLFYQYRAARRTPHEQLVSPQIDLRFVTLMRELDLPQHDAHDALNDAVMAALAFIKLRRLLAK